MATDPVSMETVGTTQRGAAASGLRILRRRRMHRLVILATSALALAACSSSDGGNTNTTATSDADVIATGPTSSSAELGRIIFVRESLDGSGRHVFSIDPDGTGEIQLIAPAAETPLLSPDGS